MKKITGFLFAIFVFMNSITAQSGDEKKIADNVTAFNKGLVDADNAVLTNLIADELSYGHSNGKVENKTQFLAAVQSGPDFLSIDISDQTIQITGNTAIVRHIFFTKLIRDGKPDEIKIGVMMVWFKQKNNWKLLARQAAKYPMP